MVKRVQALVDLATPLVGKIVLGSMTLPQQRLLLRFFLARAERTRASAYI